MRQPVSARALFAQDFFSDQKAIWTSPFHLHTQDKKWLVPLGVGTLGLVASDQDIMRHFGNTPMAHSSSFSNYGLAAMVGGAATLYLRGAITHDDHGRETGFLAGEAAVNSLIVGEDHEAGFPEAASQRRERGQLRSRRRLVSLGTCAVSMVDRDASSRTNIPDR